MPRPVRYFASSLTKTTGNCFQLVSSSFYSSENLFFWLEVEQFKTSNLTTSLRERAQEIFDIYLTEGSPYRIPGIHTLAKTIKEIKYFVN